jgi:hypothetical protein
MSMSLDTHPTPATQARYSGWHKVTSPGIGPLGLAGTIAGISGLVAAFLVGSLVSPVLGLVLAVLTVAGLVPLVVHARDGRTGYGWAAARIGFGWARARGRSRYTPAMLGGRVAMGWSGPSPAPGLLARSQLRGVIVPLWGEVGVLRTRANRWTVLLECPVPSADLVDPDTLAGWTEAWGHWLASLPHEAQVQAATVTIESFPDTGQHLIAETARLSRPGAPDLAGAFLDEVARTWPGRAHTARVWVAVVFSTARPGHRPATRAQMCDLISERVAGLCASLARGTGNGATAPMTPGQLVAIARTAYDPQAAGLFDAAQAAGIDHGLTWAQAGPVAAVEEWDHLRHDAAVSITWKMTSAPAGDVPGTVLAPLLDPTPGLARKRVTLIYRHHDAAEAARIADADLRTAASRAGERRGQVRAGHAAALEQARTAADEQAAGAGLTRLSLLVTATVTDPAGLPAARTLVEQLGAQSRLVLRPCYGSQAAAFTAALGLGVLPTDVTRIPDTLRDAL